MKKQLLSLLSLSIIISANSQTTIVDVTNPITGATWMDRNLGATQVATSTTDAAAYGDLYQWGRAADGHQLLTSGTTTTLSTTETPGHSDFIISTNSPTDWLIPQNDNLWQGVSGINNPCPLGYRLPTINEFMDEYATWGSPDDIGAFNSVLKLSIAGNRQGIDGSFSVVGITGYYYTSNVENSNAYYLAFNSAVVGMYSSNRANGMCIRCIKDASAGIKDESNSGFSIYPNPSVSLLTIQTEREIEKISIFNITGELVQQETSNSFSVVDLPSGIYILQLNSGNGILTKRFVKE